MEEISKEYKSYIELREILKYADSSIVNKIPKSIFKKLDSIEDNGYKFRYDLSKSLNDQKILKQTKELLAGLYIKYCCDENTSKRLIDICKQNDEKYYKQFEIEWNKNNKIDNLSRNKMDTNLVKQDQGTLAKIFYKIKKLFKKQ